MTRQSISFTNPNNDWLNAQVSSEEFTSKSDVVNDLIRKARAQQEEIEFIRTKLIKAEQGKRLKTLLTKSLVVCILLSYDIHDFNTILNNTIIDSISTTYAMSISFADMIYGLI
jgi:antitoxin ParD1/3/4